MQTQFHQPNRCSRLNRSSSALTGCLTAPSPSPSPPNRWLCCCSRRTGTPRCCAACIRCCAAAAAAAADTPSALLPPAAAELTPPPAAPAPVPGPAAALRPAPALVRIRARSRCCCSVRSRRVAPGAINLTCNQPAVAANGVTRCRHAMCCRYLRLHVTRTAHLQLWLVLRPARRQPSSLQNPRA